ncbi:hypothetical protein IEQ34_026768 [Dendrobium chrysotoxum]|uniref:Uncharacterized protein n=1 Tax=Dendrobium chrysotoxum TaxID=161865 RepID=A0AAV7FLF4_DENCH|nr:hypothetical protein IEQ34_026768 [Dendrobium chrysotoxum]
MIFLMLIVIQFLYVNHISFCNPNIEDDSIHYGAVNKYKILEISKCQLFIFLICTIFYFLQANTKKGLIILNF